MSVFNVEGKEYNTEDCSKEVRSLVSFGEGINGKIQEIQKQMGLYQFELAVSEAAMGSVNAQLLALMKKEDEDENNGND
jgi:hypothetical protein